MTPKQIQEELWPAGDVASGDGVVSLKKEHYLGCRTCGRAIRTDCDYRTLPMDRLACPHCGTTPLLVDDRGEV